MTKEKAKGVDSRKLMILEIYKTLGSADIKTVEFEGPEIAVYVKKPQAILELEDKIKSLAKTIRKRIVIRSDPETRMPQDAARNFLLQIAPPEAEVTPDSIFFDPILGEMRVLAKKPGLLAGRDKSLAKKILAETGWRLEAFRKPPAKFMGRNLVYLLSRMSDERVSRERRLALRRIGDRIFRQPIIGSRHVRVVGLGSFGEVGRSAILVDTGESRVLLDAGLSPTGIGQDEFPLFSAPEFRIDELDAVVISHAHLDHVGALPILYKYGFRGPVYVTPPTKDLMILILQDIYNLARAGGRDPPFTPKDIENVLIHTITVNYNVVTDVAPDMKLTFTNAGHILGSALVHLHIGQGLFNLLYTGDFKYYRIKGDQSTRLLPPANDEFYRVEAMIMEATYGATETQPRHKAEEDLIKLINEIAKTGGKLLIPVMAVGRAQEILVVLNQAKKKGLIPDIPIFIDGVIREVNAIYSMYPELLAKPIRDLILQHDENPFIAENQIYVGVEGGSSRDEVLAHQGPAIILATNGMMQGGPIIEYFKAFAEDEKNVLAFVSYQAQGTLGRQLMDGAREIQLEDDGRLRNIKVKLKVVRIEGFTGHSVRSELQMYLRYLKPKPRFIALNHGEPGALMSLATAIKTKWNKMNFEAPPEVIIPENLETVRFYPRNYRLHTTLLYHGS